MRVVPREGKLPEGRRAWPSALATVTQDPRVPHARQRRPSLAGWATENANLRMLTALTVPVLPVLSAAPGGKKLSISSFPSLGPSDKVESYGVSGAHIL